MSDELCRFFGLQILAGYASETYASLDATVMRAAAVYASACLVYILLWMPIFTILYNIYHPEIERTTGISYNNDTASLEECNALVSETEPREPPSAVQFIIYWLFASFAVFPAVHLLRLLSDQSQVAIVTSEIRYAFASFFSKLPLLAVIASGIVGRRDTIFPESNATIPDRLESPDSTPTLIGIGVGVSFSVVLGMCMWISFRHTLHASRDTQI